MFVVGDEKQSIYSFQGADPAEFGRMRGNFDRMLTALGSALAACDLCIRSVPRSRSCASSTRCSRARRARISAPCAAYRRISRSARARRVVAVSREGGEAAREPLGPAARHEAGDDPVERLATRIAAQVRGWLDASRALPGRNRPIRAGDVLVLVQSRNAVFHAVIRALKAAQVPVAGADVLRIGGELAVRDLLAALRVAATSADDLSLAALLRSPLGGYSETALVRSGASAERGAVGRRRRDRRSGPRHASRSDAAGRFPAALRAVRSAC